LRYFPYPSFICHLLIYRSIATTHIRPWYTNFPFTCIFIVFLMIHENVLCMYSKVSLKTLKIYNNISAIYNTVLSLDNVSIQSTIIIFKISTFCSMKNYFFLECCSIAEDDRKKEKERMERRNNIFVSLKLHTPSFKINSFSRCLHLIKVWMDLSSLF